MRAEANIGPVPARSRFFFHMALAFLAIAGIGFSTTFFLPLAQGRFEAPVVIHLHGMLCFAWLLLFLLQQRLVDAGKRLLHRRLGWAGAALCAAIVVSGAAVGAYATRRDLAAGAGDAALGQFVNILIEMLLFGALVAAAIVRRRDRESHKRLLLLATISILGPAWLRFRHLLPAIEHPFIVFSLLADSLLLVAIAHDRLAYGRVHPVYVRAGGLMFSVHMIELFASGSALWLCGARALLG